MIIIRDDLIPLHLQDYLETLCLGAENINATLPFTSKYEPTAIKLGEEIPISFQHVLKSSIYFSEFYPNFSKVPQIVCREYNLNLIDIIQARVFITVPHKTKQKYYDPHVDLPEPHKALIYYVNDSYGDTAFFDNNGNITETVSPKKGRVVLFDGEQLHGGGISKSGPRCIVNYDLNL